MPERQSILQFDHVSVEAGLAYDMSLADVTFTLSAGELAMVRMEPQRPRSPLPDAAMGLAELGGGVVGFMGEDWRDMSGYRVAEARGQIGRTFLDGGWISNLDIDENVTLAERHHTRRRLDDIDQEATEFAQIFGLSALPHVRPAVAPRSDLRRAALVRAFLGRPILLVLESPVSRLDTDVLGALVRATSAARSRGAAVLWTADSAEIWGEPALQPTARWRLDMGRLVRADEQT
jgi:phospholipid/cholesterol/gamma-HCH transport system ATP-binding protein